MMLDEPSRAAQNRSQHRIEETEKHAGESPEPVALAPRKWALSNAGFGCGVVFPFHSKGWCDGLWAGNRTQAQREKREEPTPLRDSAGLAPDFPKPEGAI